MIYVKSSKEPNIIMNNTTVLISNFLLATLGIAACLLLQQTVAVVFAVIIVSLHLRLLKPYEWRLLIQLSVLGWVANAMFLRMQWLQALDSTAVLPRILCWTLFATMLCHSLYPIMRRLSTAMALGAVWGVIFFSSPVISGLYLSTLSWPQLGASAAISGMLLFLLAAFIIKTRVFPALNH